MINAPFVLIVVYLSPLFASAPLPAMARSCYQIAFLGRLSTIKAMAASPRFVVPTTPSQPMSPLHTAVHRARLSRSCGAHNGLSICTRARGTAEKVPPPRLVWGGVLPGSSQPPPVHYAISRRTDFPAPAQETFGALPAYANSNTTPRYHPTKTYYITYSLYYNM